MRVVREYNSYEEYTRHQKEKTLDPVRRQKWMNEEWGQKIQVFETAFKNLPISIPDKYCLCVCARTGQEVQALRILGAKAIGIDLVANPPFVAEGDMHQLPFVGNQFDLVFCNSLDHSLKPEQALLEMRRVVKSNGFIYLQLQLGIDLTKPTCQGYDILEIKSNKEVFDLLQPAGILVNQKCKYFSSNWEMLLQIEK